MIIFIISCNQKYTTKGFFEVLSGEFDKNYQKKNVGKKNVVPAANLCNVYLFRFRLTREARFLLFRLLPSALTNKESVCDKRFISCCLVSIIEMKLFCCIKTIKPDYDRIVND